MAIRAVAGRPGARVIGTGSGDSACLSSGLQAPWHFLYSFPEPHQQGSLRPILAARAPAGAAPAAPAAVTVAPPPPEEVVVPPGVVPSAPSPMTSGRLSCMRRAGGAGGCTTVTRKIVWVTSWRIVDLSSSNIRYASILNSFNGSRWL